MSDENQTDKKRISKWSRDHWLAISGVIAGSIIAVSVPIWETYYVDQSSLSIEINSIKREVSPSAGVTLENYPELKLLRDYTSERGRRLRVVNGRVIRTTQQDALSPEELKNALSEAKKEIELLPEKIESQRQDLAEVELLSPELLTERKLRKLNRRLEEEVDIVIDTFAQNRKAVTGNKNYFNAIIGEFRSKYVSRYEQTETRYKELQSNLPLIERKIETLANDLVQKNSFFTLSTVLINSGRASTSIKKPALLRIYIGTGNYVDLKLKLQDYDNSSEVPEHSTRIANFTSNEISSLPVDDQKLINTYWGQSVQALLFTEEISGGIVKSNSIAFSEGLYEKIIYDKLRAAASKASIADGAK